MSVSDLSFFLSTSHECSYLADHEAASLVADPTIRLETGNYSDLIQLGFRRSGGMAYRPHCGACKACIAIRVPAAGFHFSRGQRRIWKKNDDLEFASLPLEFHEEHYQLYQRYQSSRHKGGSMDVDDREKYTSFFTAAGLDSRLVEFRHAGKLLCVAVIDWLPAGLSSMYTFFDPEHENRGLGVYAILWQIVKAQELGLSHVYLGYWIKDCEKMSYKIRYRPYELFVNQQWHQFVD
ncbi:MAG: arginyltransferase [Gammaproteobacteria bacterium]|nr:arginyltransferase [Gammaproteobacteria bacterium]